jgi:phasin family protein
MYTTPEQLSAANKANVETLVTIANTAFASAERFAALNLNTARMMLEETAGSTKTLMTAKDARELMALQTAIAQPVLEKAVAYSRSAYEIATQTQEAMAKLFESQLAALNNNVTTALDKASQNAPAGSDLAINAVKSAIAAANTAYASMNKAAKQVAEMAEANVANATNATFKAKKAA